MLVHPAKIRHSRLQRYDIIGVGVKLPRAGDCRSFGGTTNGNRATALPQPNPRISMARPAMSGVADGGTNRRRLGDSNWRAARHPPDRPPLICITTDAGVGLYRWWAVLFGRLRLGSYVGGWRYVLSVVVGATRCGRSCCFNAAAALCRVCPQVADRLGAGGPTASATAGCTTPTEPPRRPAFRAPATAALATPSCLDCRWPAASPRPCHAVSA